MARMRQTKNKHRILELNLLENVLVEDREIDGRIALKRILGK
jgi:hypothetical protein